MKSFLDCAAIASSTFAPILVAYLNICLEIMNSFSFFSSMKRATIDNAKSNVFVAMIFSFI